MWNLPKPDIAKSIADLDEVEEHSEFLKKEHFPRVIDMYVTYDANGGHVSDRQHDGIPEDAKHGLSNAYPKTYEGKEHHHIADELKAGVGKCPMCSIGNANTLDHFMEKSKYPALKVMRQNLVPMCRDCNGTREKNKVDHTEMLHAYYDLLPTDKQWLQVRLTFGGGAVAAEFYPDPNVLTDPILYDKAVRTIAGLELNKSIAQDMTSFLSSLIGGKGASDRLMLSILQSKAQDLKTNPHFGLNHWKTVLLMGIAKKNG